MQDNIVETLSSDSDNAESGDYSSGSSSSGDSGVISAVGLYLQQIAEQASLGVGIPAMTSSSPTSRFALGQASHRGQSHTAYSLTVEERLDRIEATLTRLEAQLAAQTNLLENQAEGIRGVRDIAARMRGQSSTRFEID